LFSGDFEEMPYRNKLRNARRKSLVSCYVLAGCVALASAISLLGYAEPGPTLVGMVVLFSATVVMPWLAIEKRRLSAATDSAALRADAAESAMCAYLSIIALLGVGANLIWHIHWTDPVAALIILPLILSEGREAMRRNAM
jgi:divalent metal cation (Fe/Co/Zn/Cd) transporter